MRLWKAVCLLAGGLLAVVSAPCQTPLVWHFGQNKTQHLRVSGTVQAWARHTTLNEGSTVNGKAADALSDVSIRRYRLKVSGQLSQQASFVLQVGNNNLNRHHSRKNHLRLLDAYVVHQFADAFALGVGKSAFTGLSRYAAPATGSALAHDINYSATPFLNIYDDFFRRVGVFAKGQAGGWDYRIALGLPSPYASGLAPRQGYATVAGADPGWQGSAYVKYQFQDHEPNQSAFSPSTYLGKKRLVNLGWGVFHQADATWSLAGADTLYHHARSMAVDLFLEQPAGEGTVTFYLAGIRHRLGKHFVRALGPNNPATGSVATLPFATTGNRMPVAGTGNQLYAQLACLRAIGTEDKPILLQPYATLAYSNLAGIAHTETVWACGLNYYINGQHAKLTLGYENRPDYAMKNERVIEKGRKSMVVLQYQLRF